jgi:hypothetical protein
MASVRSIREELARILPMAAAAVALGITAEFLVAVRPVEPLDPPMPTVDGAPLAKIENDDAEASRRFSSSPAPAEVRAIGSAFLAWNVAASEAPATGNDPMDPKREALTRELRMAMGVARAKLGDALMPMLRDLRAHQTELFMRELDPRGPPRTQPGGAAPSKELRELGGALVDILHRNGWIDALGRPAVPRAILRARYKLHWTSMVFGLEDCDHTSAPICYGLTTLPLEPAELRALLSFLVLHPVVRPDDEALAGNHLAAIDRRRLVYIDRLVELDQFADPEGHTHPYVGTYEVELARGAMLYRLGNYAAAADVLRAATKRDEHDMRARNWFLAALAKLQVD